MCARWMEPSGKRFNNTTQDSEQFKSYELFVSDIFLLIFFGPQYPGTVLFATAESKISERGNYCYLKEIRVVSLI